MKTKISLSVVVLSAIISISCKKELEPQESSTAIRTTETANPNKTATTTSVQQTITQPNTATQNTTAGLNPAHGQPGHRCDIAVGAPLNSKAGTQPTQVNPSGQPIQIQNQAIATTQPVKTAKGMNPPHGQPGHRCDIPVGAPLNSKPGTTTTTSKDNGLGMTVTPANVSSNGAITPQNNNNTPALLSTGNTATTAAGMNPAHGQPGHKCEIPVGSPLNQENKTEEKKSE